MEENALWFTQLLQGRQDSGRTAISNPFLLSSVNTIVHCRRATF